MDARRTWKRSWKGLLMPVMFAIDADTIDQILHTTQHRKEHDQFRRKAQHFKTGDSTLCRPDISRERLYAMAILCMSVCPSVCLLHALSAAIRVICR